VVSCGHFLCFWAAPEAAARTFLLGIARQAAPRGVDLVLLSIALCTLFSAALLSTPPMFFLTLPQLVLDVAAYATGRIALDTRRALAMATSTPLLLPAANATSAVAAAAEARAKELSDGLRLMQLGLNPLDGGAKRPKLLGSFKASRRLVP
ncbi:unnamed protein product, partial [Phaeothamnion confervicola]